MARFRLARPAQQDLASILSTSAERWGRQGGRRYAAVLAAAMRKIGADPEGPLTRSRDELSSGLRSFHIRHTRVDSPQVKVGRPVHILYYRKIQPTRSRGRFWQTLGATVPPHIAEWRGASYGVSKIE